MKYYYSAVIAVLCLTMGRCSVNKELNRDFDTAMKFLPAKLSSEDETKTRDSYHRGYHMYMEVCSGCHGDGGRDTIPYFSFSQLDNYNAAAKKGDPENHAVMRQLSPEQVSDVLLFLFYRTLAKQSSAAEKAKEPANQ